MKIGGGPLVYAASDTVILRPRATGATLGVVVPGLRTIETIESETGLATAIQPPTPVGTCSAYPVAIAAGDLDSDGDPELGVIDPTCGNWIAKRSLDTLGGRDWHDFIPDIPAYATLTIQDIDGDSQSEVIGASPSKLSVVRKVGTTWSRTDLATGDFPFLSPQQVKSLFARVEAGRVLFQHQRFLSLVDLNLPDHGTQRVDQRVESATWLRPFVAFDDLSSYSFQSCPMAMLGIGLASSDSGPVPREIQLLEFDGARTVRVTDSGLDAKGVQALSVVPRRNEGDFIVGIINSTGAATSQFILAGLSVCNQLVRLSAVDIDFDWRTPESPPGFDMPYLARRGVVLAGMESPSGAQFFHYDGFTLRTFTATFVDMHWMIESRRMAIHDTREDIAW